MMDPKRKALLLEFLRDPDIVKIKHRLSTDGDKCFCLEGAMCEVYRRFHPPPSGRGCSWTRKYDAVLFLAWRGHHYAEVIAPTSVNRYFLAENKGDLVLELRYAGQRMSFVEINDKTNLTFPEIADLIETQL